MKGVVAAKPLPNYFNEESLIDYFYRKGAPDITYNKEVFALCGGNTLTLQDEKMTISKYWILASTGKYNFKRDEDWYDCTRELLYRAIEKRLNPCLATGITLSGGLDSTSIACILSELLLKKNKPLYAFSSVLPIDHMGIEKDERHYIEIVGKHCHNIIQTYEEARGVGPLSNLDVALDIDETFPNTFFYMDKALLEAATKKNIGILYNGFGGDYWLSNKGDTVVYDLINSGSYADAFRLIKQFHEKGRTTILHELRIRYLSHTAAYKGIKSIIKTGETNWQNKTFLHKHFIDDYFIELGKKDDTRISKWMKQRLETGRIGRTNALLYNRNSWYAMDSSIPLFDKELMEFLTDVPERLFVENGTPRNLIRRAMRNVIPPEISQRTDKQPYSPGFPTRLISQKELLLRILNKPGKQATFEKYINTNEILDHFNEIAPFKGFGNASEIIDLRVAQAVIVCYQLDE
jgi:asparagine synthase (glutamine-hydrolysing)